MAESTLIAFHSGSNIVPNIDERLIVTQGTLDTEGDMHSCSKCNGCQPRRRNRNAKNRSVLPRTMQHLIVCILLQFLLTFAQGQGHGDTGGVPPVDERVQFEIYEEQNQGSLVGTIRTEPGLNYKFSEEPAQFTLNAQNGEIRTSMRIDRESLSQDYFDLFIQSVPSARHLIEVSITILDINDNSPTFGQVASSGIQISFSENDQAGTQVILDTAVDKDVGENDVTDDYRIISGNEEGKFRLVLLKDTSIPLLYLENVVKLDREEKDTYQLNISAQDGGNPPRYGYLTVNIAVRDYNDNPPIFDHSDYFASVNETTPVDTFVIKVRATDLDSSSDITYKILNDDFNQFTIDPKTGIMRTLKKLNCKPACDDPTNSRCHNKSCFVTVEASDNGQPTPQRSQAYVTVLLIDENDHDPVISFRYSPSSLPYATVDESALEKSPVAVVSVSDEDHGINGETTIQITKGNELGHFSMKSQFGIHLITVAGTIDREVVSKYNLTIVARDMGVPSRSSTAFLIIVVNDINDHEPKFEQTQYQARLSELVPVGSFVAGMTASDDDTGINAQITYRIVSGNELGWFKIDSSTGLVTTQKMLDREQKSVVEMSIRAQDGASRPYSSTANLTVTIWDENDETPTFPQAEYKLEFQEGAQEGLEIITFGATDRDQGQNGSVRYTFSPDVELAYPGMFQLRQLSDGQVQVRTLKSLDREMYDHFTVKVLSTDQGSPPLSGSAIIMVDVKDINDNSPVFYPVNYYALVMESHPPQTKVVQVSATDADVESNGKIRYVITEGAEQKFTINEDSGWIITTQQLDKNFKSSYRLKVMAYDGGNRNSVQAATVDVSILDENDLVPTFSQEGGYSFSITEDNSRGSPTLGKLVGIVQATAQASSVSYSINGGDPNRVFQISGTGSITTTTSIDREEQSSYILTIVARSGGRFAETTASVTVRDVNDNAPTFNVESAEGQVMENWPVGHDVFLAQAIDADFGDNAKVSYTLDQGTVSFFEIDEDTGMILVAQSLSKSRDREFVVTVTATDSGSPSYTSKLSVTLTLVDVNDHTPMFTQTSYEVSIAESRKVNDQFYEVSAEDADFGRNAEVCYEIVKGNNGGIFGIFPNGILYIAHELDRELRNLYVLTIKAFDKGLESRSSFANITVHVLDVNDNQPIFSNQTYIMQLEEGESINSYVGTVYASDRDSGRNAELSFTFKGAHEGFDIHAKSGVITSTKVFDREQLIAESRRDHVTLSVFVSDSGAPPQSDTAIVNVVVKDTNDNAPVFENKVYIASVYENAQKDSQIDKVSATDADDGDNARVAYAILSGNDGDMFRIDPVSGSIILQGQLDRETKDFYSLIIMATDQGYPTLNSTGEVNINVLDYNDNAPQIIDMEKIFNISENTRVGEFITQVQAFDVDLGNNADLTYSISSGKTHELTFSIDSSLGKISLAAELDYETHPQYNITVTATDAGISPKSSSIVLTINVVDYNDNAPKYPSEAIFRQISENVEIGSLVTTVTAQDPDSGLNGQLRYNIRSQLPGGNHFEIDKDTGEIKTAAEIDREFSDSFKLTVVATDQAEPANTRKSAEKVVTIVIFDLNDNKPKFLSPDATVVILGAQKDTRVTQIQAVDPDEGKNGQVTYELVSFNSDLFSIDENTGNLYLIQMLKPQPLEYSISIRAMDKGDIPLTNFLHMTVLVRSETDNGPPFSQSSYSAEVYENEPAGTSIVTVSAFYDDGRNAEIEYYITKVESQGVDQPRYFQVHRTIGLISILEPLDRELGYDIFSVEVYAVDKRSPTPRTRRTVVQIRLLDRNDSPPEFILGDDHLTVAENARNGDVVTTLVTSDADQQGAVKYTLIGGAYGQFDVDITEGTVTVLQPLDRETRSQYNLIVSASDGEQSSQVTLHIEVTDINDEKPVFTQKWYSFDIPENTQTGLSVGQVHAFDTDSEHNAQVSYGIVSHWGRDKFSLDPHSGVLRLIGALDYEQTHHYVLTVRAHDGGTPAPLSSTATVYINVLDHNNNAPVFDVSSYRAQVYENASVGASVLTVTATDVDSGMNSVVKYSIVEGNLPAMFSVDGAGGVVRVARTLDREQQHRYVLSLQAEDQAANTAYRLSSTAMVTIDLLDTNDNAPVFETSAHITVPENTPTGTSVYKVIATDADQNNNGKVLYSIISDPGNAFNIGRMDGVLRVSQEFDRETIDEYSITVRASDQGTPAKITDLIMTVMVGDKNDHEPVFDPSTYSKDELAENTPVGTSILTVMATDMDAGLNADIRYLITDGDDNHDFYLNTMTGELSVQKRLDYERHQTYKLTVMAQDLGDPMRTDTAQVTLSLYDINDCPPRFIDSPYVAYVQENIADLPVHIAFVTARDDDSGSNGDVGYSITEGDRSNFRINSTTGEIMALKTLDREEKAEYELVVQAMDKGFPRLLGFGHVKILVGDSNDNAPAFRHQQYKGAVRENMAPGTHVAQITAEDADTGRNAEIRYSLLDSASGRFVVDAVTGVISTGEELDREEQEEYRLVVQARDRASLPLSSTAQITVMVQDVDDNTPRFMQQQYQAYLRDPTAKDRFVLGVTALDPDYGENGEVEYSLVGTTAVNFAINVNTGVITAGRTLVGSDGPFNFHVRASPKDKTKADSDVPVRLDFLPSSITSFPQFYDMQQNFRLSETINTDYLVMKATATSSRPGAELTYHIAGGNQQDSFKMAATSGELRVKLPLDYETVKYYNLWLRVQDDNTNPPISDYARVSIEVTDENDCIPQFNKLYYNATVMEREFPPIKVTSVTASDKDSGDNGRVTYRLVAGNEGGVFEVEKTTGRIDAIMMLDREKVDRYSLVVEALDHGDSRNTATATVDIVVQDNNDNYPVFTQHFHTRITENAPNGSFVLKITSNDADVGENNFLTYTLHNNPGNKFQVDPMSGNITVAGTLDRETKDEYVLKVAANDGSHNIETDVSIDILDANDNSPKFENIPYTFLLAELQPEGTAVGKVVAKDADAEGPNSNVFYMFKPASAYFHIASDTGVIIARKTFEFKLAGDEASPENVYKLNVMALDRGEPPMTTQIGVTIMVQQANRNAPVFENPRYTAAVDENAGIGQSIIKITASDVDVGMNADMTYSIQSSNSSQNHFFVDPNTGVISVANSLSQMASMTFHLKVKAEDRGQPPKGSTADVYIQVAETNRYQPQFVRPITQVTIPEDRPSGTSIAKLTATDRDVGANGRVEYFITGGDPDSLFEIDRKQGNLKVSQELDYETKTAYVLTITARDEGLIPKEASMQFTVTLRDVNDSPPVFDQERYIASVKENSPVQTSVFTVVAEDADTTGLGSIEYYITGDRSAIDTFTIDSVTGVIKSAASIDYESQQSYEVHVKAINPGTALSGTTVVEVQVTGENEFIPRFTEREFSFVVSESASIGHSIGHVEATDEDEGQDAVPHFYLIGDSNSKGFAIIPDTGDIIISGAIDREATAEIILDVLAKNAGPIHGDDIDTCQVRIVVRDANDPPMFKRLLYEDSVSEGDKVGTSVLQVSATDNDLQPDFKIFTYSIIDGNVGGAFKISRNTGWISTNSKLDREMYGMYNLTVGATDSGRPPKTGTTSVKIRIEDVNDNGPYFSPSVPIGNLTENQEPFFDIGINLFPFTKDLDLSPNQEPYKYRLVDHTDIFEVGITSGKVKSKIELDRETTPGYMVKVEVGDNGNPVMTSTLTFSIAVQDVNDNPSSPRPLDVFVYAYKGEFTGGKVANVRPKDIDQIGDYRCQVTGGDLTYFSITQACNLHSSRLQDMGDYQITVSGSDGIHEAVSYSVKVAFRSFDESAVNTYNTAIIKLRQITSTTFLRSNYKRFLSALQAALSPEDTVLLYSMRDQGQPDGTTSVILLIAAHQSSGAYFTKNQLGQRISSAKSSIESSAGVLIDIINYNPCVDTICANGAECTYALDRQEGEFTHHMSESLAFTSPKILLATTCNCREGFTGPSCQDTINKCQQNPCQNSGTCIPNQDQTFTCRCPPNWTGDTCEEDVDECVVDNPCKNGGTCEDLAGSYNCQCPPQFQGKNCDISVNLCKSAPCQNGGTCKAKTGGYDCECQFGFHGQRCELASRGFNVLSYEEYDQSLDEQRNTIKVQFATIKSNALIFYSPVSTDEFMALEIINGEVQFSFALGDGAETLVKVPQKVNDGGWWRVEAERNGKVGTLKVTKCKQDGTCQECSKSDTTCFAQEEQDGQFQGLDSIKSLFIGGVPSLATVQEYPGQVTTHDFVGCMRNLQVDNMDLFQVDAVRAENTGPCERANGGVCNGFCSENAVCYDDWTMARCQCNEGFSGDKCQNEGTSFSFGENAMVKYKLKDSYKRDQALSAGKRKKRATDETRIISLGFRTYESTGILFYSTSEADFTMLYIDKQLVNYASQSGKAVLSHEQTVSDGQWHNISLTVFGPTATLLVDKNSKQQSFGASLHDPIDSQMLMMSLGGTETPVTVPGSSQDIKGFKGCMDNFVIDGENLPLSGSTDKFDITVEGEISASCDGYNEAAAADEGPPIIIVVVVIVVFFALVIIAIVISFFVIRARRKQKEKDNYGNQNGGVGSKSNGSAVLDKTDSRSHQDSGYTEGGADFNEEAIISQHIQDELQGRMYNEREISDVRPDIIGEEAPSLHDGNVIVEPNGMDNIGYLEEPPEHYDIDNASSIAPSDLVDVVGHYKRYRSGLLNQKKHHHQHHHHHPIGGHRHGNPSPNYLLAQRAQNQSPASISSRSSPNILNMPNSMLGRNTPIHGAKSPLTINNINHYNQLNRQQATPTPNSMNHLSRSSPHNQLSRGQSPAPNIPMKNHPSSLRSTPLSGISGLYPSNVSDSSMSTGNRHMAPRPNSKLKQPINQHGLRASMTPTPVQGLTVEEVNRLNARHKLSPVSTVDALSSSSDGANRNINRTDFTHSDLLDPTAMMPPESSSEDETNDSFTCSEFEYSDHDKIRNDLHPSGRGLGSVYPSRLARVDENDTDTTISRTMNHHDSDSNHESISTFFTTSDEDLPRRPGMGLRPKLPNGALNWDYLLNWGPNFEKLVGVFSDIAQLPDSDTDGTLKNHPASAAPKPPPPRPPKNNRSPMAQSPGPQASRSPIPSPQSHHSGSVAHSPLPNGISHSPSPLLNIPHSQSPMMSSPVPHPSLPPTPIPPLAHTNHTKSDIPVGSVPPHPRSPHPKSPIPENPSPQPKANLTSSTTTDYAIKDTVSGSYLEEYV